jgi:hypothetical protein
VAVAKKDISSVLKSGLPATAYVEDYETRRVLESIKTALRLLGNVLNGTDKSVDTPALLPEVKIDAGPNIQVARKGVNWFRVSAMFALPESGDQTGGGGGANFLFELGDVTLTSPTTGQVLKYDGSKWVNGAGGNPYSFQFTQTSDTGGTLCHGKVYVKGVPLTCSGWTNHATGADLTIASITVTTYFYWLIDLAAATAAWTSNTTGFPAVAATVYPWPILTLTCADSVITAIKEHRDVQLPGNV